MDLQCEIVDHTRAPQLEAYVERLVEVRRKKNVTADMARDLLNDPNYFGTVRAAQPTPWCCGPACLLAVLFATSQQGMHV